MKKGKKKSKNLGAVATKTSAKSYMKTVGSSAGKLGLNVAGFCAGYGASQMIKSNKPMVNGGITVAAILGAAAIKNPKYSWAQRLILGLGLYFGVKTLNNLTEGAVAGLQGMGVAVPDSVKKIIAKVVPSLGDAEASADDTLSAAEYEVLQGAFGDVDPSMMGDMGRLFSRNKGANRMPNLPAPVAQRQASGRIPGFAPAILNGLGNVPVSTI